MKSIFVTFRGQEVAVSIDRVIEESDVNYYEIQWHFENMSAEAHNALNMTDAEDAAICAACWKSIDDEGYSPECE